MRFIRPAAVVALALLGIVPACSKKDSPGPTAPNVPPPTSLTLHPVAGGFDNPVYLVSPPGDNHRMFIVEKGGAIRIIKDGTTLATPFLDITGQVATGFEQGLLSMAFRPDYATSGRFYIVYTQAGTGDIQLERWHVSSNPDVAAATKDETVLTIEHSFDEFHNGGLLAFGPDGMLYLGVGDGGGSGDPLDTGQDPSDMLGSILRIDVRGSGSGYAVPPDNPFGNAVWCYGLRNPWRYSFDRETGDLYIGDVGQGLREEVDVATNRSGRGRGLNFGWSIMEGTTCFEATTCNPAGLTMPVLDYPHTDGNTCVIGGYVYRGSDVPGLRGRYFYTDLSGGWIRSFVYANGQATDPIDWNIVPPDGPLSWGEDARGELYLLTDGGLVYRLAP